MSSPSNSASGLLQPGRNCWRIEPAQRFAMLVDADAYFRAVRAAIRAARHSIFILSWDIDSRMLLVPSGANDGLPEPLGEFLNRVVATRHDLHVYVLNWDFAMLYALEREWLPVYKLDWNNHRRLSFRMDCKHPLGASHHQKVVVVDDSVAFVGGLDLTRCRWDTPAHAAADPLRQDTAGKPYAPFHDVQAAVDGAAARALGELCRQRWRRATGHAPAAAREPEGDPWPEHVIPDLTDVEVAIARTEPAFNGYGGVHEVRQLLLDTIGSARQHLFFESQYFTSGLIANALARRLAEPGGPEVAVLTPQVQCGWLEEATMGVLRSRVHRALKAADRYARYRLYSPHLPELKSGCLNLHSKVFAADDMLFSIGSANLSSRSMALDTECNLAIEARGPDAGRIRAAIARMRDRLLAEHLGCEPDQVAQAIARDGSLHDAIGALRSGGRTLQQLDPVAPSELDALIPAQAPFDPEKPVSADALVAQLVPAEARKPAPRRFVSLGALALCLLLLAAVWRYTPLREGVNLASLVNIARGLQELPFTPIAVLGAYVLGGFVLPITALIAATGIVFGPVAGAAYALAGSLLSAAASYGLGRWLGRDTVRALVGDRINRLSQRIARRGILAVLVVRVLPVAPFPMVNVVAGASHLRFRDYLLGTLLGMAPGIVLTVTFVHNLAEAIRNPSPGTLSVLAIVALFLIGLALLLQRLLPHNEPAKPN
jgi:phospholipase D1/2